MSQTAWKLVFPSLFLFLIGPKIQGQDAVDNVRGYSCSDGPKRCNTYAFYKAQAPKYLDLVKIGDLFGVQKFEITVPSSLPGNTSSVAEGQGLFVPIKCGCVGNYSQANILHQILAVDTFWKISTQNFEYLTTYQAVEIANPHLVSENLTIGSLITIPIRCQCPSEAQISKGINTQITYVVQREDTLESISEKFLANLEDLMSAKGMPSNLIPNTTLLVPISVRPKLTQSPSSNTNNGSSVPAQPPSPSSSSSTKLFLGVGSGIVACMAGALWVYFYFLRRKRAASISGQKLLADMDLDKLLHHIPRRFKIDDLIVGTNNFSEAQKLGQGGFGGVYKCNLVQTNEIVAVKRISEGSRQGIKEFISEVSIVSRLRHRNLVQLLGWCHEQDQLLLVYEYMSNGSLDRHIFPKIGEEEPRVLQWSIRYKIASEIASALLYLHEEWDECVVHRDVKSGNILLDSNFSAKIGDFGLARMVSHERLAQTTRAAGTLGYLAPECVASGKTSPQSDVYSFGAVALEIASGKQAIDVSLVDFDMRLVAWAWDLYGGGRLLEGADVRLNREFKEEEMERLMVVGLWCSHPDATSRPKMRQVLRLLNFEVAAPLLPPAMPVPSYETNRPSLPVVSHSLPSSLSPR
ncbi:hypothetical protein SUGI_0046230 [Cryptomeria japonica]|uniref:L-type lectin-domain containing receptor kinase IX.2 n=1 Tax=Cryptomeria japonica TaxID=3369 RepID=UPI002408B908|nr:L-type lectin-domain containing receptor kinase IX.2 [Cryptomeria japonica]GLJ06721.1 hypothetical protein SUGI_0046230 [Cryptomeria japonica]